MDNTMTGLFKCRNCDLIGWKAEEKIMIVKWRAHRR